MGKHKQTKSISEEHLRHLNIKKLAKNISHALLALIGVGAVVSVAAVLPGLPIAFAELAELFEKTPQFRRNQILRRLQKQRVIEIHRQNGNTTISLTEKGRRRILTFNLDHLELQKPRSWDKKWRIISFDIPEKFERARRSLRMKMRELGFYPFQKSVFIHPYPCRDEIDFVADFYRVGRYLNYIEANYLDDEDFLKQHFGLS